MSIVTTGTQEGRKKYAPPLQGSVSRHGFRCAGLADPEAWQVLVEFRLLLIDADLSLAQSKIGASNRGTAISFDIQDETERGRYIRQADIVISLLPPALHIAIARDCVKFQKHLLTASYLDDAIRELEPAIAKNKLLFLYEMGLDPGIDHMSAMQLIYLPIIRSETMDCQ